MNQKEIFLRDLCSRLPYGVKVRFTVDMSYDTEFDEVTQICDFDGELCSIDCGNLEVKINTCMSDENVNVVVDEFLNESPITIDECKPYLRPMESMTKNEEAMYEGLMMGTDDISFMLDVIDWLNAHHFDFRGLIKQGLALEAPTNMYND